MAEQSIASPREGRFGAFSGVFTPSILTIIGVVMYLRFGWVVGNVGLGGALLIVCLAHLISITTSLSVASIATNRTVGAGGAYYMISRSLGAPSGAAVGIPLFFAQALSIAFYIVGFCEALQVVAPNLDPRILGTVTCIVLTGISMRSADIALKLQFLIMAAIVLSLVSIFAGGTPGGSGEAVSWWIQDEVPFTTVFAVFFPAVTGIMAGISMSGDLKNPRRDLPRGTLAAVLVGFVIYLVIPVFLARHATPEELRSNMRIFWDLAAFPGLIYAGVLGATLSSAIGCILTAPRTLQAIAADGLAPRFLAKGSGAANEPRAGLLVTFFLAELGILTGSLNTIASILTMFFLVTYGVTNLACGLERWASSPSFRPQYSVPWLVSVCGAIACFYVMSLIDFGAMCVALLVCGVLFVTTKRKTLKHNYGDARHGIWAALVRSSLIKLKEIDYSPQNWRPNLVVFGGDVEKRKHLMEIGDAIVQDSGVITFFHLLEGNVFDQSEKRAELRRELSNRFNDEFPTAFSRVDIVPNVLEGIPTVAQSYGMGTFEANTVLMGWTQKGNRIGAYMTMLRNLHELDRSLLLLHYDHEAGFGQRRNIDLWWGGMTGNGALMLLVGYLLTNHVDWRGAEVRLITIVNDPAKRKQAEQAIHEVITHTRVQATPHVLVRNGETIPAIMRRESSETDLAMIGILLPKSSDADSDFFQRFQEFTHALPTTLLVSSAPEFEGVSLLLESET